MIVDDEGFIILTGDEYTTAGTEWELEQLKHLLAKQEPPCDWDDSEVTPPNGQPLNCYYCGGVTRTTRFGVPICKACDTKAKEHA